MHIEIVGGVYCAMGKVSPYKDEDELLIDLLNEFIVLGVEKDTSVQGDSWIIYLRMGPGQVHSANKREN